MLRRLWRLVVTLSSVLFVGTALLWARSYWVSDSVTWQSHIPAWVSDSNYGDRLIASNPETWSYIPVPAWVVHTTACSGGLDVWFGRQSYLGAMTLDPENGGWHYESDKAGGYPTPQFFWPSQHAWYSRRVCGFQCGADVEGERGVSTRFILIPIAAIASLFALPPAAELWRMAHRRKSRRRQQAGQCPACGYDLRASKDRCPECGWPVAAASDSRSGGE